MKILPEACTYIKYYDGGVVKVGGGLGRSNAPGVSPSVPSCGRRRGPLIISRGRAGRPALLRDLLRGPIGTIVLESGATAGTMGDADPSNNGLSGGASRRNGGTATSSS